LADVQLAYLRAQHAAGAQALMLFDSWSGLLGPETFSELVLPSVRRIRQGLADTGVPFIYFPFGGSTLLETLRGEPFDVVGIDWRLPLSRARAILGDDVALQGNLDPAALFADRAGLTRAARRVIDEAGTHPGHIFNLGHGIEPDVDPDQVAHLIDVVHDPSD
ncbi:MAG: uroporphyrinogen decarboxylase, partial [Gemmatimonadetes bacterium]|nr:uroporphyrinogen decarboxylase [Gemmatimonadota bacterium]